MNALAEMCLDKREFYTRGTLRIIRIPRLAKISTPYRDWNPWNKKRVNSKSCMDGKGCGKDIQCITQNAALFVYLL